MPPGGPQPWLQSLGLPDRMGYRPVMKAALLGVHRGEAARWWVSFTPPSANRSILGVLKQKTHVIHDDLEKYGLHCAFYHGSPPNHPGKLTEGRVTQHKSSRCLCSGNGLADPVPMSFHSC